MYSHSRIQTFEQCPRKYKFRYKDKLRTETEGIEAFVGKCVHESLEKLYRDLKLSKMNSLEEILALYESSWEKNWHEKITVVRDGFSPGHYFSLGQDCLRQYYRRYQPFNQGKTLGLEERIEIKLTDAKETYEVQGFIDRLTWIPETATYEIHDYKTGNSLPSQEELDRDRQLALYQLGLMQRWPDARTVKLVWHYLAMDKEFSSTRTTDDLKALERQVIEAIHAIEAEEKRGAWEPHTSRLCEWCEYKPLCPAFKHESAMETLPVNEYLKDSGVQLVKKMADLEEEKADLQAKLQTIDTEQSKIKEALIAFCEKEGLTAVDGPGYRARIKTEEEFKVPRKTEDPFAWELLRTTLKNAGKLEEVSTVNANMLKFALKKGGWEGITVKSILGLVSSTLRKTVSLVKK
jgi:putative RecB family exonuclease